MEAVIGMERRAAITKEEEQEIICKLVLDSYQDMLDGKGQDYKEAFAELERRYKFAKV